MAANFLKAAFDLVLTLVVARFLGAREAGIFFSSTAVFTVVATVMQSGASTGIVRAVADAGSDRGLIYRILFVAISPTTVLAGGAALALFLSADGLSEVIVGDTSAEPYIRTFAVFVPMWTVLSLLLAASRGLGAMLPTAAIDRFGVSASRSALALILLTAGFQSYWLALSWAGPIVVAIPVASVWLLSLLRRQGGSEPPASTRGAQPKQTTASLARGFWAFSGPRGLAAAFQAGVRWLDVPLVAALASPAEAGIYAAASRLVLVGSLAVQAVGFPIAPLVTRLLGERRSSEARVLYRAATAWSMAISLPIYFCFVGFSELAMSMFGAKFATGSVALFILSIGMLVRVATGPISVVLLMVGRTDLNVLNTGLSVGANVLLNLWLIPRYGLTGAAIAWSISLAIENLLPLGQLWLSHRLHPIAPGFAVIAFGSATIFPGSAAVAHHWLGQDLTAFFLFLVASVPPYSLILWKLRGALHLMPLRSVLRSAAR